MAPATHVLGRRVAAFVIDTGLVWAACVPVFFAVSKTGPAGIVGPFGEASPTPER